MSVPISDYDVIFISYDEPNADENWAHLQSMCPWAKRSHGVFGSDACHKAAAKLSETERFIGIDADNKVRPDFFELELNIEKFDKSDVLSWSGKNIINGLVYGNGGIKLWPVNVVEQMRTHEEADNGPGAVDFCWDIHYHQLNNIYSDVYNNETPYQAYRAGFREGVKLALHDGQPMDWRQVAERNNYKNHRRLLIWMSVGADVKNGLWAMYGARLGCYMTNMRKDEFDFTLVRDFEWHNKYWHQTIAPKFEGTDERCPVSDYSWSNTKLLNEVVKLGRILKQDMGLEIANLDEQGSRFYKASYFNPIRLAPLVKETDVDQLIIG
jgi:hypothetical protein